MAHTNYLTYDEYVSEYGGTVDQTAFPLYEQRARKRIDFLTDSRVQAMAEVPAAVKICMVSLINMEGAVGVEAQATNPQVTSFNTDGYSESYGNAMSAEDAKKEMDKLVIASLYGEKDDKGVHLLYRGARL